MVVCLCTLIPAKVLLVEASRRYGWTTGRETGFTRQIATLFHTRPIARLKNTLAPRNGIACNEMMQHNSVVL